MKAHSSWRSQPALRLAALLAGGPSRTDLKALACNQSRILNEHAMKLFLTFIAGLLALPVQPVSGPQSADETRDALRAHDRAVHLHDAWVRDPYIILGADGYSVLRDGGQDHRSVQ